YYGRDPALRPIHPLVKTRVDQMLLRRVGEQERIERAEQTDGARVERAARQLWRILPQNESGSAVDRHVGELVTNRVQDLLRVAGPDARPFREIVRRGRTERAKKSAQQLGARVFDFDRRLFSDPRVRAN